MNAAEDFERRYGPNFTWAELRCKCDACRNDPNIELESNWYSTPEFWAFMKRLKRMRDQLGFPFPVNSGYRCPAYNDQIYVDLGEEPGTHLDGPHTIGAADIKASFERAYQLVAIATDLEMGVGIDQKGDVATRYVHVDNLGPRIWTY